jgi:hypothetical protein
MEIWTIIAPFMLGLTEVAPFWIYLTMGALLTALSIPGVVGENGRDLAQPRNLGLCHCHLDLRLSPFCRQKWHNRCETMRGCGCGKRHNNMVSRVVEGRSGERILWYRTMLPK